MFMKVLKVVRNHPKKTIFFATVIGFGARFAKGKYEDQCLMRAYCEDALRFGEKAYQLNESERHVTVILNPSSCEGKGKNKYEKYCAPLLHLSGMKVALVRTEYEGHAKEMMGVIDNTEAVIVAGGDGTLSEVLTGLLRREDAYTAAKRFPLGILPLGEKNLTASSLWGFQNTPGVKHLAESTMAVIRNIRRPLDIIEITPLEEDDVTSKRVYAVSEMEWGAFRDAEERKSLYWYWAFLKKYMVYVFSSYKDIYWNCAGEIEYSSPCSGCSNCKREELVNRNGEKTKRWWQVFRPRPQNNSRDAEIDYSKIINLKCGVVQTLNLSSISDVRVSTCNSSITQGMPGYALNLRLGKTNLTSLDFIVEGWKRQSGWAPHHDKELSVGKFTFRPKETAMTDKEGKARKMSIDNDLYEVRPMVVKPLPNVVTIFASVKEAVS